MGNTCPASRLLEFRPFWIGVNYWPRSTGPLMWHRWEPGRIAEELRQMRALGLNVFRSFLYTPDFLEAPGRVSPVMLERFGTFLDLCGQAGLRTLPTLLVGHMSGENWEPAWWRGRDPYRDPGLLEDICLLARAVAEQARGRHAVAGWILTNEMPLYRQAEDPEVVAGWVARLARVLRAVDPALPVGVGDGAWNVFAGQNGFALDRLQPLVDFFGPHVYRSETDGLRLGQVPAFAVKALEAFGRPVVYEEFGCSSAHASDENAAAYYRTVMASALGAGAQGVLAWCFSDFALPEQRPYLHHPFELLFGITRADGSLKPSATEMARFARILRRAEEIETPGEPAVLQEIPQEPGTPKNPGDRSGEIGGPPRRQPEGRRQGRPQHARWSPQRAAAYLIIPSYYNTAYPFSQENQAAMAQDLLEGFVLARQADIPVGFWWEGWQRREGREGPALPDPSRIPLLLAPVTQKLLATTWEALEAYVRAGGTFYLSYFAGLAPSAPGLWIHNFERLTGARHQLRYGLADLPEGPEAVVRFVAPFGSVREGAELRFPVSGPEDGRAYCPVEPLEAEVVAIDGHGRPVLLVHRLGRGRAIFCSYPIEYYLAHRRNAHLRDTRCNAAGYLLYDGLAVVAGVERPFRSGHPLVEVAPWLKGGTSPAEALLWVINHSDSRVDTLLECCGEPFTSASVTDLEEGRAVPTQRSALGLQVPLQLADKQVRVLHLRGCEG